MQVLRSARGAQMILIAIIAGGVYLWATICQAMDE